MSKYKPLSDRLAGSDTREWRASLAEIEEVLGFPLPKGASAQSWWMGAGKPHHAAWTAPGWSVLEFDREGGTVLFSRSGDPEPAAPADAPLVAPAAEGGSPTSDIVTAGSGSETSAAGKGGTLRKMAMPAAVAGGAAAVLAGAAAVIAGFLAKRKGEPWR